MCPCSGRFGRRCCRLASACSSRCRPLTGYCSLTSSRSAMTLCFRVTFRDAHLIACGVPVVASCCGGAQGGQVQNRRQGAAGHWQNCAQGGGTRSGPKHASRCSLHAPVQVSRAYQEAAASVASLMDELFALRSAFACNNPGPLKSISATALLHGRVCCLLCSAAAIARVARPGGRAQQQASPIGERQQRSSSGVRRRRRGQAGRQGGRRRRCVFAHLFSCAHRLLSSSGCAMQT